VELESCPFLLLDVAQKELLGYSVPFLRIHVVWQIDYSDIIYQAQQIVKDNNLEDGISAHSPRSYTIR
jgi:hypothetical protein